MRILDKKKLAFAGLVIAGLSFNLTTTGCLTDSKKDDTTTAPKHTAFATEVTLDVGAQGASAGSVIDIDSAKAWDSKTANANQEKIDLVFMNYGTGFHLDNAVAAKAAGVANSINLTNTYDDAKIVSVKIVKVTTKPADQEALKAAFTAGTVITGSVVATDDMFIVQSTGGKLALVTVGTIVGSDKTGGAKIKLIINTI